MSASSDQRSAGFSLARRQTCRSDVARAVESRASWWLPCSSRPPCWRSGTESWRPFRSERREHRGVAINENSPLAELNKALGDSKSRALLDHRTPGDSQAQRAASSLHRSRSRRVDRDAGRAASKLPEVGRRARVTAVTTACRIFDRFAVEPAPARWIEALKPLHDLLSASLADADPRPRYAALREISRLWVWIPGRSLTAVRGADTGRMERRSLRPGRSMPRQPRCPDPDRGRRLPGCVADRQRRRRRGRLSRRPGRRRPRRQTLSSFAQRNLLLTDDMLLKRLHDEDPIVRDMANLVLKTRGLSQELISLGGLMFSPKADQRVSVIPLLKGRTDVDPVDLADPALAETRSKPYGSARSRHWPSTRRRPCRSVWPRWPVPTTRKPCARLPASSSPRSRRRRLHCPPCPARPSLNPKAN